ncbi:MAG: hypothetical protein II295_00255 [Akkermansia sp.]|nr:hypothetical protein [Akkermansia sp.]
MKMRLPKTLMVALVAAMAMNTASAVSHTVTSNETITSGSLTTDSVNPGATHVITKTGEETVSVTGSVTKYASLYVHEGEVKVGDGVTDTTLTVRPYQTIEGSLIIGGQDAVVTFDNANYKNANNGFIGVGTQDGSGKLYLTNGSTMTGDCEKFTIGSSTYASTSGYNEGTFHEAANGSGEKFGRGEVFVSGGSKMDTAYRSFYMGEGLLSVEGTEGNESSVVIGNKESSDDSYKGYRVLLGIEKNSTSDIEVSGYGKVEVNAGEFRTNTASNSTTNITVSGPGAEFNVGDVVGKYTTAWVGYDNDEGIEDSSTNFNVENGGAVNFTNDRMVLGGATSEQNGNSVSVKVQDDESSFNFKGTSASMYAGVAIENKGTVKIDSANSFYMSGGEIVNDGSFTTNDIDISGAASSIKNNGTFTAEDYTQKGGETVNNGTISAKTYYQTAGETVNNGTIALTGSGEHI